MRRVALALIGILVVAAVWWAFHVSGPWCKGRTVYHWFKVYDSWDQKDQESAIVAFQAMGSKAVPMLVATLESPPSQLSLQLNSFLNGFRRVKVDYEQQHSWRRQRACDLLREMGESARGAFPSLEKASTNSLWYIATSARATLIKLRDEPLAPYIALLNDRSDPIAWYSNAMMLADCGTNAGAAVPVLLESLQNSNNIIQAHALIAMGMIRCEPQACVPAIIPFLTNADVALRQKSYFAVLQFKDQVRGATEEILLGLKDPDAWIRKQALLAVDEILSPADQRRALPQVEALRNDPYAVVRDSAKKLAAKIVLNEERRTKNAE